MVRSEPLGTDVIKIGDLSPGMIALLKQVAEETVKETFRQQFTMMGLDPNNPIVVQQTFHGLRDLALRLNNEESQADRDWTRRWRKYSESVVAKVLAIAAIAALCGGLHNVWAGAKDIITSTLPPQPPH